MNSFSRWLTALAGVALPCLGCAPAQPAATAHESTNELRRLGPTSNDGEWVGRWELNELFAPDGTLDDATAARHRLDGIQHDGMWASLARAAFDDAHGNPRAAAEAYVQSLEAAATHVAPEAPLVAWFAVRHLLALRESVTELFASHRRVFDRLLAQPGRLGWRAVAELEDWRAVEVYDRAELKGDSYDAEVTRRMGCAKGIRIAGPFGHGVGTDVLRSFPAESPLPWPAAWAPDPLRGSVPRVLPVTQKRCLAVADEQSEDGVFYIETFVSTRVDREMIVAVQGAVAIWVDGTLVLSRGTHEWGSWQRFGAHLLLAEGRHRILARSLTPGASVRLLNPDGTAAAVESDGDPSPPTALQPPRILEDPNPVEATIRALQGGQALAETSPVGAALAAFAAHVDQADDVASAILEPLTKPANAGPLALEMASVFAANDPALPEDARGVRSRALRDRALARDPRLWRASLAATLDGAEQHGLSEAVDPLRRLAESVAGEPEILEQLGQIYGRLGWRGEQVTALRDLTTRFPDDAAALRAYLEVLDEDGPPARADEIAARIKQLDPDAEVDLDRALARQDYAGALRELDRLKTRRPDRKDIATRTAEILARSGDPHAAAEALQKALEKHPSDAQARFRLADRALADGDTTALRHALAGAIQAKAQPDELRAAIDLVEGATDLEPFRQDGRAVIRDFQAWEKAGHHMDGTAARVLDYSAIWAHSDGSSEMLEHEIQKLQSQEAVHAEAETEPPEGLVLHLRVIKPDGRILEPESVSGKATLTLPHLEVGDFIEVEHVIPERGQETRGRRYESPHWFFREADKGYWRSEFVVVSPSDRPLQIETRGNVPAPETKPLGSFVERKWRVDLSPPAELEPESPPITEFLPSVRVGWGVSLADTVARLADLTTDLIPLDPRLRTLAQEVVRGVPSTATDEQARRLYRWVMLHIQDGKENDGRRVITGGTGSRQAAFRYLLRLVSIPSELCLVKDQLSAPPLGPMSEVEQYDALVLRLTTDHGVRWLTARDKFAPFGYLPSELRDQPAIRLVAGTPSDITHAPGAVDRLVYEGRADVAADGSAALTLAITFEGNRAIAWRTAIDQVPQAKLYDFVERELIAGSFDGGHVREVKLEGVDALDQPLVMHLRVDVPELAKSVPGGLELRPPFAPNLSPLAALPSRRTPVLRRTSTRAEMRIEVVLPLTAKVPVQLPAGEERDGSSFVTVHDAIRGHAIDFDRVIDIPSGRIAPGTEYAAWQQFVQRADALLSHDILVGKASP